MDKKIRVGLIYGSTREGRFCDKVAAWAAEQIVSSGKFAVDIIDPLAIPLDPDKSPHKEHPASIHQLLDRAGAFVVVTPEYNHGYVHGSKDNTFQEEALIVPHAFKTCRTNARVDR